VIVPGSFNLRIGVAEHDERPLIIPNCIAWRRSTEKIEQSAAAAVRLAPCLFSHAEQLTFSLVERQQEDKMEVESEPLPQRMPGQPSISPMAFSRPVPTEGSSYKSICRYVFVANFFLNIYIRYRQGKVYEVARQGGHRREGSTGECS
jgi:hypothetical protein